MYFWIKVLHISAMTVWFAGLFFLPRMFVARRLGESDGDSAFFGPMANALYFRVLTPAALLTIGLGSLLIAYGPYGAWLVMKVAAVSAAVLIHVYFGSVLHEHGRGRSPHGPALFRVLGWVVLLLLLGVVGLTGARPVALVPASPASTLDAR